MTFANINPKDFPGQDVYAVVGNPIEHSKSPLIQAEFARQTGDESFVYGRILAPLDQFQKTVNDFFAAGGKGLNVTVPFKLDAYEMASSKSEAASIAQAANVLYLKDGQLCCDNTDGIGLCNDLNRLLHKSARQLQGVRVLLLGAGGAAQGVIHPLLQAQVGKISIWNRTHEKVQQIQAIFPDVVPLTSDELLTQAPFDLIINATASGLSNASPISLEALKEIVSPQTLVYDMVYGQQTPFMTDALSLGLQAFDGLGMLVEQAAQSYRIWRGVKHSLDIERTLQLVREAS
jgi:shikimate dehydrogenase